MCSCWLILNYNLRAQFPLLSPQSTENYPTMSEGCLTKGPWLATRFWNDIVLLFRSGMPCKRHRVHMKNVERCFSGSEAISWLHTNLMGDPRFVQDITREQTVLLLQKFLQTNIIEIAHSRLSACDKRYGVLNITAFAMF